MTIQINHLVPEKNEIQTDILEDVEYFSIKPSLKNEKQMFIDVNIKKGTKKYEKLVYHVCGIYIIHG